MEEANPSDLNLMPLGIWFCQVSMAGPNIRKSTPRASRCAATDRPYGPAPTIATSIIDSFHTLSRLLDSTNTALPDQAKFHRVTQFDSAMFRAGRGSRIWAKI